MLYKVLNVFPVGQNTSVTIEGNGSGLKNNISITGSDGRDYHLLSVAMTSGQPFPEHTTILLVEGTFDTATIRI